MVATVLYSGFAGWQLVEIHRGAKDTQLLAESTKTLAEKTGTMSNSAEKIKQAAENMVAQEQRIADNAKDSLDASNRQSKAALDATIAQFRADQRAWVGVSEASLTQFERNKPIHVDVVLLNTGKTPARRTHECIGYVLSGTYLKEPPAKAVGKCERDWKPSHDLPPQGKFINRAGEAQYGASPEDQGGAVLLMQSYDPIKDRTQILYIFGEFQYLDTSARSHTTRYCVYISDPDAKVIQFCDGFNDMD